MGEKKGISHGPRFPRVYRPGGAGEGMGSFRGWGIELHIIDVNRFLADSAVTERQGLSM